MTSNQIVVYGAYGHTGRFVVSELLKRGLTPILSGRDSTSLETVRESNPGLEIRPASVDDSTSLDRAFTGAACVLNCAGPFVSTAAPVIEAALRARIPYLDVAAEIEANLDTFEKYSTRAHNAEIIIVPAMAFYGGLGDLLATAAMGDWLEADEISIAYGLDSWKPTFGTRAAGRVSRERRNGQRIVFSNGKLELRTDTAPVTEWNFPLPLGLQPVVGEFTMADTVTIARHLKTPEIRSYMTTAAVKDVSNQDTPPPDGIDENGRSAQTFIVDVTVKRAGVMRRAAASGQDIYAVSAPLIVEAATRVLAGSVKRSGVLTAGQAFDAKDFLRSLSPTHLSVQFNDAGSDD